MTVRYLLGDTRQVVAGLPDASVDLVLTSPPFLALRSYLPADDPNKHLEIGSDPHPAAFIDTMLGLTAEWRRVLAPHGSIAVEFGDTYSGSGGAGGDYGLKCSECLGAGVDGGHPCPTCGSSSAKRLRQGQPKFEGSARRDKRADIAAGILQAREPGGHGWPLPKSLALIPELYRVGLAYGINALTGEPSPAGRWRVRNVVRWVRPNPPVGALGDKFRPATSDLVIACVAGDRWFDLDAVRTAPSDKTMTTLTAAPSSKDSPTASHKMERTGANPAGAPPLDWWEIVPGGYSGKVATTRREPCGPHDGGERTTSPDCPVHGGLPGQLPKALRDAREGASSPRTRRIGDHLEQALPLDSSPTDETPDRSGSSADPTLESSDQTCAPAATPHDTGSSRTAPALATSPAGTPSARTDTRTGDTSASPESNEPHPDTPASSTSPADLDGSPSSETPDGSAGSSASQEPSACTCSFHRTITEYTSHYAVFPPELCVRPIEAMCPRRVCRTCGKPSRREVQEQVMFDGKPTVSPKRFGGSSGGVEGKSAVGVDHNRFTTDRTTTGWSTCGCPGTDGIRLDGFHTGTGWRPGIVLDPFGGSGTTGLVAHGHSRDAILVDLDPRNVDLARERLGMFLDVA